MQALIFDTEFTWPAGFETADKNGSVRIPHPPNAVIESIAFVSITGEEVKLGTMKGATERDRVGVFVTSWAKNKPTMVSFNGRCADVPLLLARCIHHRIVPGPWTFDVGFANRYRSPHHVDLYDVLGCYGANRSGGLHDWARCVGWPGKMGTTGDDVAALLKTPNGRAFVDAYCLADAVQTAAVWLRFCLLTGSEGVGPEKYARLAANLHKAALADERTRAVAELVDIETWIGAAREAA
mgnify:CR=1 FL=1